MSSVDVIVNYDRTVPAGAELKVVFGPIAPKKWH